MALTVDNLKLFPDIFLQFMTVSGGIDDGANPPAFQRAEKERMEKATREKNEGGVGSEKQCSGECNCCLIRLKFFAIV